MNSHKLSCQTKKYAAVSGCALFRTIRNHTKCTAKPTLLKKVSWIRQLQAEALFSNESSFFIVAPIKLYEKPKITLSAFA